MDFDPSIISAIPGLGPNPIAAKEKALTIGDMANRQQLNQLRLNQEQRGEQESQKFDAMLKNEDLSTPQGLARAVSRGNKISPRLSMDLMKFGQSYQSGKYANQISQLELASKQGEQIWSNFQPILDQANAMKQGGASDLDIRAFIAGQMPGAIQTVRSYQGEDGKPIFPDNALRELTSGPMTLERLQMLSDRTETGRKQHQMLLAQLKENTAERKEDETERHNRANESTAGQRLNVSKGSGDFGGQVGQVLAAMSDIGVSLPTGLRAKQQMLGTIQGLIERHPDEDANQIAARLRSAQLRMQTDKTEATVVARREGAGAAAITALNRKGGLYDQALETGKKVDFGKNKVENAWELYKQGKVIADPNLSEYINTLADTRAEFASVLARSGQVTDSVRIAAEHAFPDKMSYAELERNVARSKKIAASIQAGNEDVADAIINGKSLSEALKESPGADDRAASTPRGADKSASGGPLEKGKTYKHSSGATVEIIE